MTASLARNVDDLKSMSGENATTLLRVADGTITIRSPGTDTAIASGPRCVVTKDRDLVCTFMVQAALGLNDFCPMLARSKDQGTTWHEQGPLWPHLSKRYSIFGSVSTTKHGELLFYGSRTPIAAPAESNWCERQQGLKANELIWAHSVDNGRTWSEPTSIPMPIPGAAEAPGPLCASRNETWHVCYAPYNTFDPKVIVPRNQVVLLSSSDRGRNWRHSPMMRFRDELSTAAEAWVVELANGQLLGTCWNLNQRNGDDYPNAYALSNDGGHSWSETRSTGIFGQATSLTALPDGSALFLYNQRRHGTVGVWLARVRPTEKNFGVLSNEIVWAAPPQTADTRHSDWVQFTFGEPSATLLDNNTILVAFWCIENSVGSIRYVKLQAKSGKSIYSRHESNG